VEYKFSTQAFEVGQIDRRDFEPAEKKKRILFDSLLDENLDKLISKEFA
jgi:hypothetical protein